MKTRNEKIAKVRLKRAFATFHPEEDSMTEQWTLPNGLRVVAEPLWG